MQLYPNLSKPHDGAKYVPVTSEPCGKESPVGFSAAILAEYEEQGSN